MEAEKDCIICKVLAETEETVEHRARNTAWFIRTTAVRYIDTPPSLLYE